MGRTPRPDGCHGRARAIRAVAKIGGAFVARPDPFGETHHRGGIPPYRALTGPTYRSRGAIGEAAGDGGR